MIRTKKNNEIVSRPLSERQRWGAACKRKVVLRILRGETIDALSRELNIEIYRREEWRKRLCLESMSRSKKRQDDTIQAELNRAMRRTGELPMENELLWNRVKNNFYWLCWRYF